LLGNNLAFLESDVRRDLQQFLVDLKREQGGSRMIAVLGSAFSAELSGIGQEILTAYPAFKSFMTAMFSKNTQAHGIGYVLGDKGMRADPQDLDTSALRAAYERSDKEYTELLVRYLKPHADRSTLLTHLERILQLHTPGVVDDYMHGSLPSMLATIFAIWTLSHVEDAAAVNEACGDLKKPHPAQVVAICRLLGLGIAEASRKALDGGGSSVVLRK
jgi:hypothetical protein